MASSASPERASARRSQGAASCANPRKGFFVAGGCNVAGLSVSPAIGEAVAAWIVDGAPPLDLTPLLLERFADVEVAEDELERSAAWEYRHFYGAL